MGKCTRLEIDGKGEGLTVMGVSVMGEVKFPSVVLNIFSTLTVHSYSYAYIRLGGWGLGVRVLGYGLGGKG